MTLSVELALTVHIHDINPDHTACRSTAHSKIEPWPGRSQMKKSRRGKTRGGYRLPFSKGVPAASGLVHTLNSQSARGSPIDRVTHFDLSNYELLGMTSTWIVFILAYFLHTCEVPRIKFGGEEKVSTPCLNASEHHFHLIHQDSQHMQTWKWTLHSENWRTQHQIINI